MEIYKQSIDIRWSDLDPNFHVKHSAYYDFGAYCRMCFLTDFGSSPKYLLQHNLGPVLLREECIFKRELHFGDEVMIDLQLKKAARDFSRWTNVHEIQKNLKTAAIITVDGAWIDTEKRKLIAPPEFAVNTFQQMHFAEGFVWN